MGMGLSVLTLIQIPKSIGGILYPTDVPESGGVRDPRTIDERLS